MYILHDCQDSIGSWKSPTLDRLKRYADTYLEMESTHWMRFKLGETTVCDPTERYELSIVDGRAHPDVETV